MRLARRSRQALEKSKQSGTFRRFLNFLLQAPEGRLLPAHQQSNPTILSQKPPQNSSDPKILLNVAPNTRSNHPPPSQCVSCVRGSAGPDRARKSRRGSGPAPLPEVDRRRGKVMVRLRGAAEPCCSRLDCGQLPPRAQRARGGDRPSWRRKKSRRDWMH